jgi:hypothetical protein
LGQVPRQTALVAPFQLIVEQHSQEFEGRELPFDGLGGPQVECFQHPREAQLAQFG